MIFLIIIVLIFILITAFSFLGMAFVVKDNKKNLGDVVDYLNLLRYYVAIDQTLKESSCQDAHVWMPLGRYTT
jgi:flagellar basal body-associated protein FliL